GTMTEPTPPSATPGSSSGPPASGVPLSPEQRRRRRLTFGVVGACAGVVVLIITVVLVAGSSSDKSVKADPATTPLTVASTTSTLAATLPALVDDDTTPPTVAPTDPPTTVADTAPAFTYPGPDDTEGPPDTVPPPTAAPPSTAAPTTGKPTATTAKPAVSANCTNVGSISIPATGVSAAILAERKAYSDGLLCGNHASDHIAEGVDILPGFAPFSASVAGGAALQGRVPAIIFGHRTSHNRPFLYNNKLKFGDQVIITNADGSTISLSVVKVELLSIQVATKSLLAPSADGKPEVRLVCCSHKDGSPGGVDYRWVVTLAPA
ncbi:MAG TPA: sortase, partial [Ilumatobacteraceae bacterium]